MVDELTENLGPVNWRRCFYALLHEVMAGGGAFGEASHTSADLSAWVQAVHDHGDPRVAQELIGYLDRTRPRWVQDRIE